MRDLTSARLARLGDLETVELSTPHGRATIARLGATVVEYRDASDTDVLWLSPTSRLDGSRPIRGGIPVCWPWFGAHPSDPDRGAHGFARHLPWQIERMDNDERQAIAVFSLTDDDTTRAQWPHPFRLTLTVRLDERLHLELAAENRGDAEWQVSEALHSYFRVRDARGVHIDGLAGLRYWDKQQGGVRGRQSSDVIVQPPIDRVFFDHRGEAVIHDAGRRLRIAKDGSATTVVWNPGPEGVRGFDDIPDDAWSTMLCVETANALDNAYRLGPGERHVLSATIATDVGTGIATEKAVTDG
ncbi:D-hexose-6-phosphate mutarotase [Guyparkeria hydrothermalis]|uniref:D-hexose-6-phosphate mutarotase n=1 Tax=Guyparkeria TaxID=2035712 RepID=UPI0010AB8950|nr:MULTISPECIES: D-hexose-6-phosphate mutarotase [Guyparkeria]MCL7752092.1 D-hexose-6-phosphate mutarotase [Guyparkeria hydrothermalis]TKA91289.1 D-hexose-6-phosphate mutarotase [Guyparkeria sp. SB14A]